MEEEESSDGCCPVFGVESGVPLIGLGALLIIFTLAPYFILRVPLPTPIVVIFALFGLFLIWLGIKR